MIRPNPLSQLRRAFRTAAQNVRENLPLGGLPHNTGFEVAVAVVIAFATPALAQSDDVESAFCGSGGNAGIGEILTFILGAFTVVLLFFAIIYAMIGSNKKGHPDQQKSQEGRDYHRSAMWSFGGALIPAFAIPVFDVLGINTISCFDLSEVSPLGMAMSMFVELVIAVPLF